MFNQPRELTPKERKTAKATAAILKAEGEYRRSLPDFDPNSPPNLRIETQRALAELDVVLNVGEQFTLTLDGRGPDEMRSDITIGGFAPTMPVVDEDFGSRYEQELREKIEADEVAAMSPARQELYYFQKSQREAEAVAIAEAEASEQLEARKPWIDYLEGLADTMANDKNFSDDDLRKVYRALEQVKTPGSCHDACLAMISEANRAEIQANSDYRVMLESQVGEATKVLSEFVQSTQPKAIPGGSSFVQMEEPITPTGGESTEATPPKPYDMKAKLEAHRNATGKRTIFDDETGAFKTVPVEPVDAS